MSNADIRGRFIWHELMTTDPDAASAFYSNVVPWKTQPSGMPSYTIWMSGKTRAGGLMALAHGDAAGTPPHWIIYVGTPDVDATADAARRLGGRVLKAPADIPSVGRFAVLSDPQGAAFAVFTPAPGSGDGASGAGAVGDFTWHELATIDLDAALRFYTELFGWSKGATHDMGAMGVYQLISHGGQDVGGVYKTRDASTPPNWLSYTRVADAGKAAAAVKAGGGRVLNGPVEVPGGSWIVMAMDPQGGAFAVVEAPKAAKTQEAPAAQKKPAPPPPAKPATTPPKPLQTPAPVAKPAPPPPAAKAGTPAAPRPPNPVKQAPPQKTSVTPAARTPATPKAAPAMASMKTARKKAAGKKKVATKAARKPAAKSKSRKSASKRPPAKRAAARKSSSAKRGSAGKSRAKRSARTAARSARGKSRKHR